MLVKYTKTQMRKFFLVDGQFQRVFRDCVLLTKEGANFPRKHATVANSVVDKLATLMPLQFSSTKTSLERSVSLPASAVMIQGYQKAAELFHGR